MEKEAKKLMEIIEEIDYLYQEGVVLSNSDIKTIKIAAETLFAIIKDTTL